MQFPISRVAALALLMLTTAACNGDEPTAASGAKSDENMKWLSAGVDCGEMERIQADKEARENVGLMLCGNAGHTFTGEVRCERDYIEVQCR